MTVDPSAFWTNRLFRLPANSTMTATISRALRDSSAFVAANGPVDATMTGMVEDTTDDAANVAQARLLLAALWEQVEETSRKIEAEESRVARGRVGTRVRSHRVNTAQLRKELYQLHGMIDGINRRFPQIATGV